jgi:hypothetical protein
LSVQSLNQDVGSGTRGGYKFKNNPMKDYFEKSLKVLEKA